MAMGGYAPFGPLPVGRQLDDPGGVPRVTRTPASSPRHNPITKKHCRNRPRLHTQPGRQQTSAKRYVPTVSSQLGSRLLCENHGIAVTHLGAELKTTDNVVVATMHRLKGFEYRCVAIVDAYDDSIPMPRRSPTAAVDEAQHEADLRRERCLVYGACVRARGELWVGWSGKGSRFIGA